MSTLKVDTYLTRGGASEIAIDKLKGVTAAGSMLVVGEGGTVTTNLQQGLAKAWVNFDGEAAGAAARDSFNVGSMTDNSTGNHTITTSSAFANDDFSTPIGEKQDSVVTITHCSPASTSTVTVISFNSGGTNDDFSVVSVVMLGDLA